MGQQFQHQLPNQNIMKIFVAVLVFISVVISGIVGHPRPSDDFDLGEAEADPRVFGFGYPRRDMANRQYAAQPARRPEEQHDPRRVARQSRAAPLVELTSELLARRPDMKSKQGRAPPLVEYQSELLARRPEEQYVGPVLAERLA